jgi:hypothetical protein
MHPELKRKTKVYRVTQIHNADAYCGLDPKANILLVVPLHMACWNGPPLSGFYSGTARIVSGFPSTVLERSTIFHAVKLRPATQDELLVAGY